MNQHMVKCVSDYIKDLSKSGDVPEFYAWSVDPLCTRLDSPCARSSGNAETTFTKLLAAFGQCTDEDGHFVVSGLYMEFHHSLLI